MIQLVFSSYVVDNDCWHYNRPCYCHSSILVMAFSYHLTERLEHLLRHYLILLWLPHGDYLYLTCWYDDSFTCHLFMWHIIVQWFFIATRCCRPSHYSDVDLSFHLWLARYCQSYTPSCCLHLVYDTRTSTLLAGSIRDCCSWSNSSIQSPLLLEIFICCPLNHGTPCGCTIPSVLLSMTFASLHCEGFTAPVCIPCSLYWRLYCHASCGLHCHREMDFVAP